ncbi:MAG: O-acetyl-ADP-ribose deacetylase, partial [Clostridia bacterium]|nr:O-acetyl-ADP-ribose deacetylase [Clostridia bacterium]
MPFHIIRNDITKMQVDAIVNAANRSLLGGGGVDGAIHKAAGPGLLAECKMLGGVKTGEAKITGGYRLPCRYVIHTAGPVYRSGNENEAALLASCYLSSLKIAHERNLESIAFPLISAGAYGYPRDQVFRIAADTIRAFLANHDMTVYLVIFDSASMSIGQALFYDIRRYIDDNYAEQHANLRAPENMPEVYGDAMPDGASSGYEPERGGFFYDQGFTTISAFPDEYEGCLFQRELEDL